jgi:cell wall-associated NlpC family hydrolase
MRRYRYRHPYRLHRGGVNPRTIAVAAGAVAVLAWMQAHPGTGHAGESAAGIGGRHATKPHPASPSRAARIAVAYAESKVGRVPYVWGGVTNGGMDCSGLTWNAWGDAGVHIARTSQDQWATEHRVSSPAAGDLVFFPGVDGTPSAPGHVGIVTDPARHRMVDAYGAGTLVRYDTYGSDASAPGLSAVVGFTDPAGGA